MRRKIRIALIVIGISVIVLVIVGTIFPFWQTTVWRWQGVVALEEASDESSLRAAVGKWGAFVPIKDGSWIAIRYEDSHSGGIWSLAIARDSGGKWFESNHHFCGRLRAFNDWVRAQSLPPDSFEAMNADKDHGSLLDVYNASNLEEARAALLRAGFVLMD